MSTFNLDVGEDSDGKLRIGVYWDDDREPTWLPGIAHSSDVLRPLVVAAVRAAPDAERDADGLFWPTNASQAKALAAAKKAMLRS